MKTMLVGRAKSIEKNMGNDVKNVLEAKENRTNPQQKAYRFSLLNFPSKDKPSKAFNATPTPLYAKSIILSMPTNLLSNIKSGSATRNRETKKAVKFNPLHSNRIKFAPKPKVETKDPKSSPMSQPTFVKPS